jgi:translation initiation factor 2 subunit 1
MDETNFNTEISENIKETCYFYPTKLPEKDELVTIRIKSIDEISILCSLLEYNNVEGFLPLSELSRTRARTVIRQMRVGQIQVVQVIRVDKEKGYIDLSKKYITETERQSGQQKYLKGKTVHSISKLLAKTHNIPLEEVYTKWVWPLYDNYTDPYDAFKILAAGEEDIYSDIETCSEIKQSLVKIINHRFAVKPVKIEAQIDVTAFFGGISIIKQSLRAGLNARPKGDIKIELISSPTFRICITTIHETKGIEVLENVINVIRDEICKSGGNLVVKKKAGIVNKVE